MDDLVKRDDAGHFLPGVSGNPTGRPKGAGIVRDLAKPLVPEAMAKIAALIQSTDPRVALAASQEILNRFAGRPMQAVETDVRTLNLNDAYLKALQLVNGRTLDVSPEPLASSAQDEAANEPTADELNTPPTDGPADQITTTFDGW
jgi:hypothetical protein